MAKYLQNYILPREHVTSALAESVRAHPLTVLTAPMGYGKTTAARELAAVLPERTFFVTTPPGSHNALYLWDLTIEQLAAQGFEIAGELQRTGFPSDAMQLRRVFDIFRAYTRPMLLVSDDYHYVTDPAMDDFMETLVRADMPDFRVLLLSRERPRMQLEDMRVKKLAVYFEQNLLAFSEQDTVDFFELHGNKNIQAAQQAWNFCEGWAAALWLSLQSLLTHGVVTPIRDMETLLTETVFPTYSQEEQQLLLSLSMLDSFTPWQAADISGNRNAPRLLRTLQNKNALLSYTPATESYQLHSIFRTFLQKIFDELPETAKKEPSKPPSNQISSPTPLLIEKPVFYRRAGEWFAAHGNHVRAIDFFAKAGRDEDQLRILELFALPGDGLPIVLDPQGVVPTLCAIPWRIRFRCPLGWLAFVYHYLTIIDPVKALPLFEETTERFATEECIPPDMKQHIAGEVELVRALAVFNDIFAMRRHHHAAYMLFNGKRSAISMPEHVWTLGSPHVGYMYLREAGSYAAVIGVIENNFHEYQQITGGCGTGGQELARAEYLLENWRLSKVEPHLMRAAHKAMGKTQRASLIAVHFCLARLRLAEGKHKEAFALLEEIAPFVAQAGNPLLDNSLDLAKGYIAVMSGDMEELTLWIEQGEGLTFQTLYQGINFARIVYGKALAAVGKWMRLEALTEELPALLGPYNNLFGHIHAATLRAVALFHLAGLKEALPHLRKALELARPDSLICTLAEYGAHIGPLLRHMVKYAPDDAFIKKVYKASKKYAPAPSEGSLHLSPREQQILEKVAQGLGDKSIAQALNLAPKTVRNTLSRVYAKMGVDNRTLAEQRWNALRQ